MPVKYPISSALKPHISLASSVKARADCGVKNKWRYQYNRTTFSFVGLVWLSLHAPQIIPLYYLLLGITYEYSIVSVLCLYLYTVNSMAGYLQSH